MAITNPRLFNAIVRALFTLVVAFSSLPAQAHFERFDPRVVFVGEVDNSLRVFIRMPLGLALLPTDWKNIDDAPELPFLLRHQTEDGPTYLVDRDALLLSPQTLADTIQASHQFWINGRDVSQLGFSRARISSQESLPQFSTLNSASSGLPNSFIEIEDGEIDLFKATLDVEITLAEIGKTVESIRIVSLLGKDLDTIGRLANIVTFYGSDKPIRQTTIGALDVSFGDAPKEIASVFNQLRHGAIHIVKGLDHVLIIALIALTASSWIVGLRNATAFTLGHSLTLVLGAYGFFPTANWFTPLAEVLIASTILLGAYFLFRGNQNTLRLNTVFVIGLIHGVGFSFALEGVFQAAGDQALLTLLFFNLGVEFGQIAVYLLLLPIIFCLDRLANLKEAAWRGLVAVGIIIMSTYWIFDRGDDFVRAAI